ncbi:hypothetical protein [uncultured Clostridium sp.]|nr:hypothetical protein [uncultured Clostridium sp.]
MKYIKPKKENKKKVSLELSTRTLAILEHYFKIVKYYTIINLNDIL